MTTPQLTPTTRPARQVKLEAQLEDLFRRAVKGLLKGKTLKIAPTDKGAPDRLVLLPGGRMHLVELKTESGRLSPAQRLWHQRAAQVGVHVHVIYGEAELLDWVANRQTATHN